MRGPWPSILSSPAWIGPEMLIKTAFPGFLCSLDFRLDLWLNGVGVKPLRDGSSEGRAAAVKQEISSQNGESYESHYPGKL